MNMTQSVDTWFDKLVESKDPGLKRILEIVENNYPVVRSLGFLKTAIGNLQNEDLRNAMLETIKIQAFRKEFRFLYHRYPVDNCNRSMCSATGELFSLIRQAINYNLV